MKLNKMKLAIIMEIKSNTAGKNMLNVNPSDTDIKSIC